MASFSVPIATNFDALDMSFYSLVNFTQVKLSVNIFEGSCDKDKLFRVVSYETREWTTRWKQM